MTIAIKTQNNFALAIALHCILLLCLLCPPDFQASEPTNQTADLHSTVTTTNASAERSTHSDTDVLTPALGKLAPVPTVEASKTDPKLTEEELKAKLEAARNLRLTREAAKAEPMFVELLAEGTPEAIQQSSLLELSLCAQDQNDLPRANQIYAQFLSRWPSDSRAPEILLRQGQIFRQIGLNSIALAKFYAVMTAALD